MKVINIQLQISLFFCLFVISLGQINAQVWSPNGAVWVYKKYTEFLGYKTYDYISYVSDTTINNTAVKVMEVKRLRALYSPNNEIISTEDSITGYEYMYQNGNTILWWRDNEFVPLYQFNTQTGDSWPIRGDHFIAQHPCHPNSFSDSVEVINKDVFDFGGVSVNRTFLKSINEHWGLGTILEGIGTMEGPFPKPVHTSTCTVTDYDAGLGGYLVCYYDPIRGYVGGCNASFISSVDENPLAINNIDINIFPNPTYDIVNVEISTLSESDMQGARVNIYNLVGQLIYTQNVRDPNFSISTRSFAIGVYVLSIELESGDLINKKLIKK